MADPVKVARLLPEEPPVDLLARLGLIRLREPWYISLDDGRLLWVPATLLSDGASVPAPLWGVLSDRASPTRLLAMGLAHDCAYRLGARWSMPDGSLRSIERHEADDLARALALWSGCTELDGAKIRWGLGVGGAPSWRQKPLDWRP